MSKRMRHSPNEVGLSRESDDSPTTHQNEAPQSIENEASQFSDPEVPHTQANVQGRKPNRNWRVNLQDANGVIKDADGKFKDHPLTVNDVWYLPSGTKVVVEWNKDGQLVGESDPYKNTAYRDVIQRYFNVDDGKQKDYILKDLGKKWRDNRSKLFHENYDWNLTRERNIAKVPVAVTMEQWATFIDYRLRDTTQKMCEKNAANREKQTVPHTLGSKTMARKKHELETANKRTYSRAEMYPISHKKRDGSFVNDEARQKSEQLSLLQADGSSPNEDAFAKLFGKEHPGRVRGMGFGVYPSQLSKSTSNNLGGANSCNHELELAKVRSLEEELKEIKATTELLKAQLNHFINHYMSGEVPDDFPVASDNGVEGFESAKHKRLSSSRSNEHQQNEP